MRFFAAGVLMCFMLVGCSAAPKDNIGPVTVIPATPADLMPDSSEVPVPAKVPAGKDGTMFTSTPNLVRSASAPFETWSKISNDVIAIHFVTGTPECYGADAIVNESATAVTIELRTGTLPTAANKPCMMIAVFATMEIKLGSALGTREVLNAG